MNRTKRCVLRVPEGCFDAVSDIQKLMGKRIGFAPSKTEIAQLAISDYYDKQEALLKELNDVEQKGDE